MGQKPYEKGTSKISNLPVSVGFNCVDLNRLEKQKKTWGNQKL